MKISALLVFLVLYTGCAKKAEVVTVDLAKIEVSATDRRAWIRQQKKINRARFDAEYGSVLAAKKIEAKQALQIGYLFFYSSGNMCGYLDNPVLSAGVWRIDYFPGFPPSGGSPVFVDAKSGEVWQEGQRKLDALALIRDE